MWHGGDTEHGCDSNKTGSHSGGSSGCVPGLESAWHSYHLSPGNSICGGHRQSTVSDSGDTGIGTHFSDSVEDDSSSSTTPFSFQPLSQLHFSQDDANPIVHVMPPKSSSPNTSVRVPSSPISTVNCTRSSQLLMPTMSHLGAPRYRNMKEHQLIRRWSSQGSLDRGLVNGHKRGPMVSNVDLYLQLSSSVHCHTLLQRSPGCGPCYHYNHSSTSSGLETSLSLFSALSFPVKHIGLDMSYSALPDVKLGPGGGRVNDLSLSKQADLPLGQQSDRSSPIQPAVRTHMWLTEQMADRPKAVHQISGTEIKGSLGDESSSLQQGHKQEPGINQMLTLISHPVNTLMKAKEGLLRQKELEIDRQKQEILQLHIRIRENELRTQQVLQNHRGWFDDHITKIKTRNCYISSLKKKYQRESEQSNGKQQRIETLEKYLSDLTTLDEVQAQAQQQEEVQQKAKDLEKTVCQLEKTLEEGCALMKERDVKIEMQADREKDLIASVHSLQQKVQQFLDDGVRLPMQDLMELEVENTRLLEQQDYSSRMIKHHKEQIERLTLQLMLDESLVVHPLSHVEMPEVGQLLREMSLCLLDLQALCNILAQRAQGKEPNLSLLLGMKSLGVSAEEKDRREVVREELRFMLMEVGQLRRDIDELRKSISGRCAKYMGDNCVSQ
ncbi:centrosomal protein of 85 kDa-like isoform X3 [Paralichthys olivaceus]|uniref:centrosomal protein of 85 kDa-like isoform X3 n=1 Tax=Paralichthys olivaceus TaxID=8255 RepID=UPI00097E0F10|nr:PREDICTED: centrosomal protein of 85 kDa-like isoform X5 [Paralichthys olivaceus]